MSHAWYIGTRSQLLKSLNKFINKKAKILDAGCGTGGTIKFLKLNGYTEIYGIDNSQESIKFCKINKLSHIKNGSVNGLPYKDNYFDAIICLDVLYHEDVSPSKALREFKRVLKTAGLIYSQEPAYDWLRGQHDIAIETGHRFTRKEIRNLFESTGFKINKCTYFNSILFIPIITKRLIDKVFMQKASNSDVSRLPGFLNRILLLCLLFERKLLERISLPVGLSIICIAIKE